MMDLKFKIDKFKYKIKIIKEIKEIFEKVKKILDIY